MRTIFSALIVLVFVLLAFQVATVLRTDNLLAFQYNGVEVPISTFLIISLTTIAGMVLGNIYAHIKEKADDPRPWWSSVWQALKTPRFGMSLMVTPIIVFVVFSQVDLKHADFGIALFCLQSGFFWDRTFDALTAKGGQRAAGAPS